MILVSAGHHPYARGAKYEDFVEHDEAKLWVTKIVNHLGHRGMSVPVGVLKDKVDFINGFADKAECAVEIHFNSAVNAEGEHVGNGSETLYFPGSNTGKALATKIQEALSIIYEPNRGAKEGWYQMKKDKGPDFFLAKTVCTSIIIEPEFVHHKDKIREARDAGCKVIADVLLAYCNGD